MILQKLPSTVLLEDFPIYIFPEVAGALQPNFSYFSAATVPYSLCDLFAGMCFYPPYCIPVPCRVENLECGGTAH